MTTEERDWTSAAFHEPTEACAEDVHEWFALSYASYLVWPRVLMSAMPAEWQHRFRMLAEEVDAMYRAPLRGQYEVRVRDDAGHYLGDPLRHYRHPDQRAIEEARER